MYIEYRYIPIYILCTYTDQNHRKYLTEKYSFNEKFLQVGTWVPVPTYDNVNQSNFFFQCQCPCNEKH